MNVSPRNASILYLFAAALFALSACLSFLHRDVVTGAVWTAIAVTFVAIGTAAAKRTKDGKPPAP